MVLSDLPQLVTSSAVAITQSQNHGRDNSNSYWLNTQLTVISICTFAPQVLVLEFLCGPSYLSDLEVEVIPTAWKLLSTRQALSSWPPSFLQCWVVCTPGCYLSSKFSAAASELPQCNYSYAISFMHAQWAHQVVLPEISWLTTEKVSKLLA